MATLKHHLLKTIAEIKEQRIAVVDPAPGPTMAWRVRSVFLELGVMIDDGLEETLIDIARFCGYSEVQPEWLRNKLTIQGFIDICDSQLRRLLLPYIGSAAK